MKFSVNNLFSLHLLCGAFKIFLIRFYLHPTKKNSSHQPGLFDAHYYYW